MNAEERIQAAAKFLLQSPPGEINDVLNGDWRLDLCDAELTNLIPTLRQYGHIKMSETSFRTMIVFRLEFYPL